MWPSSWTSVARRSKSVRLPLMSRYMSSITATPPTTRSRLGPKPLTDAGARPSAVSAVPSSSKTTSCLPSPVRLPHAVPMLAAVKSTGSPAPSTAWVGVPHTACAVGTSFQVATAVPISAEMSVGPLSTSDRDRQRLPAVRRHPGAPGGLREVLVRARWKRGHRDDRQREREAEQIPALEFGHAVSSRGSGGAALGAEVVSDREEDVASAAARRPSGARGFDVPAASRRMPVGAGCTTSVAPARFTSSTACGKIVGPAGPSGPRKRM